MACALPLAKWMKFNFRQTVSRFIVAVEFWRYAMLNLNIDPDDHDRGLAFDLATLIQRRKMLGLMALSGAAVVVSGCNAFGGGEANVTAKAADGSTCIKDPAETSGPFPADGTNSKDGQTVNVLNQSGIVRQDIRPSFGGMTPVAEGVQTDITIKLVDVGNACMPLANHAIYLWHCTVDGKYSLYNTTDSNYLRGVGITDANGVVSFTTIFPGCYDERWPHMHFEVYADAAAAVSGDKALLTSQFVMPAEIAKTLYNANPAYTSSVANLAATSLSGDMVFGDNTPEQISAQTPVFTGDPASGFKASVMVGIA
jgi:protocatechuate 3,4-dioxygenase beta subunit